MEFGEQLLWEFKYKSIKLNPMRRYVRRMMMMIYKNNNNRVILYKRIQSLEDKNSNNTRKI